MKIHNVSGFYEGKCMWVIVECGTVQQTILTNYNACLLHPPPLLWEEKLSMIVDLL